MISPLKRNEKKQMTDTAAKLINAFNLNRAPALAAINLIFWEGYISNFGSQFDTETLYNYLDISLGDSDIDAVIEAVEKYDLAAAYVAGNDAPFERAIAEMGVE